MTDDRKDSIVTGLLLTILVCCVVAVPVWALSPLAGSIVLLFASVLLVGTLVLVMVWTW